MCIAGFGQEAADAAALMVPTMRSNGGIAVALEARDGTLGPLDRQRRLRWDERLAVTQPSLATQA